MPLVVKEPQTSAASSSASTNNMIKSFVSVNDITPTILAYANVAHPDTYKGRSVHPVMGKSLMPLFEGAVDKVYADNEPIAGELFNRTYVRMGDWVGIHNAVDKSGVWKLYNLANDLGQNTDLAEQHPDIVQTMKTAYDKYAQDVGVIIPRGEAFATAAANVFPIVNATNIQTISLGDMFAPGHEPTFEPTVPLIRNDSEGRHDG